jgi:polar amino acid transport system substrate-binding protein
VKKPALFAALLALLCALSAPALAGDTLAAVKQKGVLVAGVKDSLPPFGYVDEKTRELVGYDIDIVRAIAQRLGVRLEIKPVTSASRMAQLSEGNIDLIAATMTKTAERAQQVDYSHTYFVTGQKFLVKKGSVTQLKDLEGKRIGTAKGSTSEQNVAKALPAAKVLSFDDYPQAFLALQQGKVFAVTTDESILAGILAKAPNKTLFEIPALSISHELYGLGMRKGDAELAAAVNRALLETEASGQAKAIFAKWFGPDSPTPIQRDFTIRPD